MEQELYESVYVNSNFVLTRHQTV